MLKWAVGQRITSSASSSCTDITESVACCSTKFAQNAFKINSSSTSSSNKKKRTRSNGATPSRRAHNLRNFISVDKENRKKCCRPLKKKMLKSTKSVSSSCDINTVRTQLSNISNALRDVSNHWSPSFENSSDRDKRNFRRKSLPLKKSPCNVSSHYHLTESQTTKLKDETKKAECHRVTTINKLIKEPTTTEFEKKKQPCNGSHQHLDIKHNSNSNSADVFADQNKISMLIDNPAYFTIQTSPPEEPNELFHKELPVTVGSMRKYATIATTTATVNCDNLNNFKLLSASNDSDLCCDINKSGAQRLDTSYTITTLTHNLSWLKLRAAKSSFDCDQSALQLHHVLSLDDEKPQLLNESSLNITNPNSAVLSSDSNVTTCNATFGSGSSDEYVLDKPNLKRKYSPMIAIDSILTERIIENNVKSKRRCVVFDERCFLNTLSSELFANIEQNDDASSFDTSMPSMLKRQRVIRRKNNKNGNALTVPQSIYNKNLKSWLTLPSGIPSPFKVDEKHFKILSYASMSTRDLSNTLCNESEFNDITKKAVSTPKPTCLLNLTRDVFLSPGIRPIDSVMQTSSDNVTETKLNETVFHSVPINEQTWNSHGKHLSKANNFDNNSSVSDSQHSSVNSSKINDDQDVFSSIVSSTPTMASSPTIAERHPPSRRCLSFVSPPTSKNAVKQNRNETGQLDLRIYFNNRMLTVHIIRARNLNRNSGERCCNAYVKVNLVPQASTKTFHRTCVRKNSRNPKFDHKFSMEIAENDLNKRVLISAWHRDRGKQKSEFLGCMSFAVKNILKKEINGSYKLLSHNSSKSFVSQFPLAQDIMTSQTITSIDEKVNSIEKERLTATASAGAEKIKSMTIIRKEINKVHEEYMFLQHLELDPVGNSKETSSGRTPFTTTHKLIRSPGGSYGFSIAWTHPPRVERVESNSPAEIAGLKPGDSVIFVNKTNVVILSEDKILDVIRHCGNNLTLEIYRKPVANGIIGGHTHGSQRVNQLPISRQSSRTQKIDCLNSHESKSTAAYSVTTAASTDTSKKRLQLPQITFSSETKSDDSRNSRQFYVHQLLRLEQQYALCLQFGISRFLLPLAERRDVIRPNEHQMLFQNVQELLRITEDILERVVQEDIKLFGKTIGKVYIRKFPVINVAYRRYCCGLKKADCILVEKTRCNEFMRLVTDPPIPKKRPDLISFIHKPLEHFRDVLKIFQNIVKCKESKEIDHNVLTKFISELQITYRDITVESGLMDCGSEVRPILSLQDLESRLVFTRCKPFVLNTQGRKWIFCGDLNRVEGKSTRLYWALLFSDILLFTKINRDRVVFVTEEPLLLATVNETQFNLKKRDTEFRLIIGLPKRGNNCNSSSGSNSPAQHGCVPMVHFHSPLMKKSTQHKNTPRKVLVFRAPSAELKAVWQNLIQRQVIKINTTGQGITPATSPTDSPNQITVESVVTSDTNSTAYKRQYHSPITEMIDRKCQIIAKSTSKGRAIHLAQWMKGELNGDDINSYRSWSEPEIETWSEEMLKEHTEKLDINVNASDDASTTTEIFFNCSRPNSPIRETPNCPTQESTNESLHLCKKCHLTCLPSSSPTNTTYVDADAFLDSSNKFSNSTLPLVLSPTEPFSMVPDIAVTPPNTPPFFVSDNSIDKVIVNENNNYYLQVENHTSGKEDAPDTSPKRFSSDKASPTSLKRYSSFNNLNEITDIKSIIDSESSTISWTNRATNFVAQKVALLEKLGENVQNSSFLDRYLRPSSRDIELTSTSQSLAFEEDCETSGGTSGDEFWGTPNSGGASETSAECTALSPTSSHDDGDDGEDDSEQRIIEEMLMNRSSAVLAQQFTPNRMLQNKTRLETLPEDEEENITESESSLVSISSLSTSFTASEFTTSCPVSKRDKNCYKNENEFKSHIGQSNTVLIELAKSHSSENSNDDFPTDTDVVEKKENNIARKKKSKLLLRFFGRAGQRNEKRKNTFEAVTKII